MLATVVATFGVEGVDGDVVQEHEVVADMAKRVEDVQGGVSQPCTSVNSAMMQRAL
jgi:hypothetical protein